MYTLRTALYTTYRAYKDRSGTSLTAGPYIPGAGKRTISSQSALYGGLCLFIVICDISISDIKDMRHALMIACTYNHICDNNYFGFAWLWYLEMAPPNVTDDPNAAQLHFLYLFYLCKTRLEVHFLHTTDSFH